MDLKQIVDGFTKSQPTVLEPCSSVPRECRQTLSPHSTDSSRTGDKRISIVAEARRALLPAPSRTGPMLPLLLSPFTGKDLRRFPQKIAPIPASTTEGGPQQWSGQVALSTNPPLPDSPRQNLPNGPRVQDLHIEHVKTPYQPIYDSPSLQLSPGNTNIPAEAAPPASPGFARSHKRGVRSDASSSSSISSSSSSLSSCSSWESMDKPFMVPVGFYPPLPTTHGVSSPYSPSMIPPGVPANLGNAARSPSNSPPLSPPESENSNSGEPGSPMKIPVIENTEVYRVLFDSKTRQFTCSKCSRQFARKSDLVRHLRIHLGIQPNVCDICGKRFIQRSALKVHKRVHTGEKPYQCQVCSRPFSDSSSLARHRRIHLRQDGDAKLPTPSRQGNDSNAGAAKKAGGYRARSVKNH